MLRDGRARGLRDTIREVEAGGSADMTGERGGGDDGCIVGITLGWEDGRRDGCIVGMQLGWDDGCLTG